MAHYAYIDEDNIVTQVIVGKDENDGDINWEEYYGALRTSYNTKGGVHINGGEPFRYNFAGIGYSYDPDFGPDGAFIPPKPFESWTLNQDTALWDAPIPYPSDGNIYYWDEETQSWILFEEN